MNPAKGPLKAIVLAVGLFMAPAAPWLSPSPMAAPWPGGSVGTEISAEELFVRGAVAHATGDHAAAVSLLEPAIRKDPGNERAWFYLGSSYQAMGRYARAAAAYDQALKIKPDFSEAKAGLAETYEIQGNLEAAADLLQEMLERSPEDGRLYHRLGGLLRRQGRLQEAARMLLRAAKLAATPQEALYDLAGVYRELGQPVEEMVCYQRILARDPDDALAHFNLGLLHARQGRHREAAAAFRRAAMLRRGFPPVHYFLGLSYLELGDPASAREQWRILKRFDPLQARRLEEQIQARPPSPPVTKEAGARGPAR